MAAACACCRAPIRGVDKLADLKGKIVAVGDLGRTRTRTSSRSSSPSRASIPNKDVDWRAYPGNLLQLAVEKGEVQAFLASDPLAHLWLKDTPYKEVASNLDGEYTRQDLLHPRIARQPGARGAAGRARHHAGAARCGDVHRAESGQGRGIVPALCAQGREPGRICRRWSRYHTHHHHPVGDVLKQELKAYADDLKAVSVFKPSTDTAKFAERIYVDVFGV